MSDSMYLMDLLSGYQAVNFVLSLPERQVWFTGGIQITEKVINTTLLKDYSG